MQPYESESRFLASHLVPEFAMPKINNASEALVSVDNVKQFVGILVEEDSRHGEAEQEGFYESTRLLLGPYIFALELGDQDGLVELRDNDIERVVGWVGDYLVTGWSAIKIFRLTWDDLDSSVLAGLDFFH